MRIFTAANKFYLHQLAVVSRAHLTHLQLTPIDQASANTNENQNTPVPVYVRVHVCTHKLVYAQAC
jgi:hypothetical protein